jgi:hypothetical protein
LISATGRIAEFIAEGIIANEAWRDVEIFSIRAFTKLGYEKETDIEMSDRLTQVQTALDQVGLSLSLFVLLPIRPVPMNESLKKKKNKIAETSSKLATQFYASISYIISDPSSSQAGKTDSLFRSNLISPHQSPTN